LLRSCETLSCAEDNVNTHHGPGHLIAALDQWLGIPDLARMVFDYAYAPLLPGIVRHQHVYLAEYLADDNGCQYDFENFGGGFQEWEVREFSLTDAAGRAWPFLVESSDDGECLCVTIIRCACTGMVLSARKHLDSEDWFAALQGFVYHLISTEFALAGDELELPACERQEKETHLWEDVSEDKFAAGGQEMSKRLHVLQNQWKAACQ